MFPDLALNPMERSETMPIEFYTPDYLNKVVSRRPRGLHRLLMSPDLALNPMLMAVTMYMFPKGLFRNFDSKKNDSSQ